MLSEVQGQDEAVAYLQQVVSGHYTAPLLLLGDDGVGKRFSVQCLARQMFCDGLRDTTCDCVHCTQLKHSAHADFVTFTAPEDKDIGIEASRQIVDQCRSYPMLASKRVVLIDGAEHLTVPAANALLKTLEEPPSTVRFFLTTTSLDRVIPTIRSRCGIVRYRRLPEAFVVSMLQPFESNATKALVYARLADGSAGQAVRFWGAGRLRLRDRMYSILKTAMTRDLSAIFSGIDELEKDLVLGLRFLTSIIHDLLLVESCQDRLVSLDLLEDLLKVRGRMKSETLMSLWNGLRELQSRQRSASINLPFHLKTLLARTFV
jgi:DNA polymerase-3 subunit delta'